MADLQAQLDEITQQTRRLVQPERMEPAERSIAELMDAHLVDRALAVGSAVPPFALEDARGRTVSSDDLLALGPLIIKFFRGRWCPYCVTELEAWREQYAQVRAKGALLVAISPQSVRQNDFLVDQHGLPFPVLQDPGAKLAASFGLAWDVPEYMQQYYQSILVNLPFIHSGKSGSGERKAGATDFADRKNADRNNKDAASANEPLWRLPIPATAIVGQNGKLVWMKMYADFRQRPEPDEVLIHLPL